MAGSASYTAKGNKKMQPQFDVLSDGWRQPGSSIKPLDYLIGHRRQVDDRGHDVHGRRDQLRRQAAHPSTRPRPTAWSAGRSGCATPSSSRSTSRRSRPGFINGLEHQFERTKDFGLRFPRTAVPVASESIGTLEVHPIDMISAYGMIANGGVLMPRHTILKVLDDNDVQVWPPEGRQATTGHARRRRARRPTSSRTSWPATPIKSVNPFWAKWQVTDGVDRQQGPAGRLQDRHDQRQPRRPRLRVPGRPVGPRSCRPSSPGVWMGNSDNSPNDGKLSLDTSAPLWSAILSDVAKGMPIEGFARTKPKGLVTATVDAFTGHEAQRRHAQDRRGAVHPGHRAHEVGELLADRGRRRGERPAVAGRLRRAEGDAGRSSTTARPRPASRPGRRRMPAWQARAARGSGVGGGPKRTRTSYFYGGGFYPFGRTWGGSFAPSKKCPIGPPPPTLCVSTDPLLPCPTAAARRRTPARRRRP